MSRLAKRVNLIKYLQAFIVVLMTASLFFATPVSGAAAAAEASSSSTSDITNPPLPKPVGRVVWVKGELKAMMQNQEQRILQKTSVIYEKDTLVTDANSQAQIVFTDNTLMTFREGSKFFVDQYSYQPTQQKGSVGKYIMNLIEGGFRTITGVIAKSNPDDYQVNTPVATIGVRGTDYVVVITRGELYIGYYTGEPCVKNTGENAQELCLDSKTPYGHVQGNNSAPVPVSQQPAVFREKLEIIPTKITPFSAASGTQAPYTPRGSGPVSSFCITQ